MKWQVVTDYKLINHHQLLRTLFWESNWVFILPHCGIFWLFLPFSFFFGSLYEPHLSLGRAAWTKIRTKNIRSITDWANRTGAMRFLAFLNTEAWENTDLPILLDHVTYSCLWLLWHFFPNTIHNYWYLPKSYQLQLFRWVRHRSSLTNACLHSCHHFHK